MYRLKADSNRRYIQTHDLEETSLFKEYRPTLKGVYAADTFVRGSDLRVKFHGRSQEFCLRVVSYNCGSWGV